MEGKGRKKETGTRTTGRGREAKTNGVEGKRRRGELLEEKKKGREELCGRRKRTRGNGTNEPQWKRERQGRTVWKGREEEGNYGR